MCTFKECSSQLFAERHTWFEHEIHKHRKKWRCNSCRHTPFETVGALEDHFRNRHAGTFTEAQLFGVVQLCEIAQDRFPPSACPLCDDWKLHSLPEVSKDTTVYATVAQFRRHLGKHLEQLALFALPKASDSDPGDEDADSNNAVVDETTSSLSNLPTFTDTNAQDDNSSEGAQHPVFTMQEGSLDHLTPRNSEQAMLAWFPSSSATSTTERKPFSETDLRGISDVLRQIGKESWSHIPRLYAVLRSINQLSAIDDFLDQGLSDKWFPFSAKTLPASLNNQASRYFLKAQRLVLTSALELKNEDGTHQHFSGPDDIPFSTIASLGRGGSSIVDRVVSTISGREYARKLISRGRTLPRDREALRLFEGELMVLQRLSHRHIIKLMGSYTDLKLVRTESFILIVF